MIPQRIYAKINLDAICHNVKLAMQKVGASTRLMAIVKADGYGHGAVAVAKTLVSLGVYGFGVATAQEALQLRKAGIQNLILILGPVFGADEEELIRQNIAFTVFTVEEAEEIEAAAAKLQKKAKIHLKIDTGMGRIGMQPNADSLPIIEQILQLPHLEVEGIFTHFACADEKDKTSCLLQKEKFLSFLHLCEQSGITFPLRHMCNSAAILDFNDDFLDMVRCGIITYGLYPSDDVQKDKFPLQPAMEIKSHVSFVKTVEPNFTVSYGSTFVTTKQTTIATVPVGYADGYPRSLSGKGYVLIHGQKAPILGRICMDQMMVDVTQIPQVKRGDTVTVIGQDGNSYLSMDEVAKLAGSFNYELACNISKRVPRVYLQNGKIVGVLDALD